MVPLLAQWRCDAEQGLVLEQERAGFVSVHAARGCFCPAELIPGGLQKEGRVRVDVLRQLRAAWKKGTVCGGSDNAQCVCV